MDAERAFQDLGVDAIRGVQIMEQLDLSMDELQIPQRFSKLQHIISFFKQFPEDTQRFLINKATRGKQVDKLSHAFEYTHLLQTKLIFENNLKDLEKEKSAIAFDPIKIQEIQDKENSTQEQLRNTLEEIYLYEK